MSVQPILELTVGAPVSWSPLLSMLAGLPFDAHFNLEILVARVLNSLKGTSKNKRFPVLLRT
jgi:hypothetical protein